MNSNDDVCTSHLAERTDVINNPPHYTKGIETIDIIRAKLTDQEYKGYLKGTIMKYNTRLGLKGTEQDEINDSGKMRWYAQKLEEFLNEDNEQPKEEEIKQAEQDIAEEILNGKFCVGGSCED
tara:strand:- start:26 stop:394 length:369 start_codon:yes stop_codon:yes gene_type:complete